MCGRSVEPEVEALSAKYLPISLRVDGCNILVVGGGRIAHDKIKLLLGCAARITVVSPELVPELHPLRERGEINWVRRGIAPDDLDGRDIVYAATDDPAVNRHVYDSARERGLMINVVDQPALCSFITPSTVRRGSLSIAINTDGRCPAMSRAVRLKVEELIDEAYGAAVEVAAEARTRVRELLKGRSYEERRRVVEAVLAADLPDIVRRAGVEAARRRAAEIIDEAAGTAPGSDEPLGGGQAGD